MIHRRIQLESEECRERGKGLSIFFIRGKEEKNLKRSKKGRKKGGKVRG